MPNLDTRAKRASSMNLMKPYALDLPAPDGTISKADRQHGAWDYNGIPASGPSPFNVVWAVGVNRLLSGGPQ